MTLSRRDFIKIVGTVGCFLLPIKFSQAENLPSNSKHDNNINTQTITNKSFYRGIAVAKLQIHHRLELEI